MYIIVLHKQLKVIALITHIDFVQFKSVKYKSKTYFVRYQTVDYLEGKFLLRHLTRVKAGMQAVTPNCCPFTVLFPHNNRYRLSVLPREYKIKFGVFFNSLLSFDV
jgi:hypothetical protein